jgi:hypothetical protein
VDHYGEAEGMLGVDFVASVGPNDEREEVRNPADLSAADRDDETAREREKRDGRGKGEGEPPMFQ